jgi:conjugal transfer/type IV secretion protein DotA/TraY
MIGVTRKQFFTYTLLPEILPRLRELVTTGFQHVPFLMALVYQSVRLLPPGHVYARSENIGQFGIRHVIAAAADNLELSWKAIDQIIVFIVLLVGTVIAIVQVILLGISLVIAPVMAMPTNFAGYFLVTDPNAEKQDLAHIMLDLVFGVPGMFNSCVSVRTGCVDVNGVPFIDASGQWIMGAGSRNDLPWPNPIHEGLHQMFQVYSIGLLVVATLLACYFIVAIILETAESGTAFGKRFNKVWAPLRLVVAFGLLIPVGHGLNSSQYIVLYAAKFGSGFATNGWNIFNNTLGSDLYTGRKEKLISTPQVPSPTGLMQFVYTAAVCWYIEKHFTGRSAQMYAVRDNLNPDNELLIYNTTTYQELMNFIKGDNQVILRFGFQDEKRFEKERGNVEPTCGEVVLPLGDYRNPSAAEPNKPEPAAIAMQAYYFTMIKQLWYETFDTSGAEGLLVNNQYCNFSTGPQNTVERFTQKNQGPSVVLPAPECKAQLISIYQEDIREFFENGRSGLANQDTLMGGGSVKQKLINSPKWAVSTPMKEKGWAAAGVWYNKIAELNGMGTSSLLNMPRVSKWPKVMEHVRDQKRMQDFAGALATQFKPELAGKQDIFPIKSDMLEQASAMWVGYNYWQSDAQGASTHTAATGNPVLDFINHILGTSGLYSMRKNPDLHPLAQLVGIGRSLIEASTRNIGSSAALSIGGALAADKTAGAVATIAISLMMTVTIVALTAGWILFYIVPMLPFIYYFFAVGGWIKAIFQAMVGAPLWALAHIRIDGNGLPGQAALGGYFLILEIFLRPILIVFGLLAGISIFGAMVSILNQTWDLVINNLSGFDVEGELAPGAGQSRLNFMRGPIDEFCYTVIYAVIVYMMAMTSFKLIDVIPGNMLRWMGQSVQPFNDAKESAAESLVGSASVGGSQPIQGVGGALEKGFGGVANTNKS